MRKFLLPLLLSVFCSLNAVAATPTLNFTDLTSGPVGAIVTIYGSNLQPSVTLNGVTATVVSSSSTKVSFVVPSTTSGTIAMAGSNTLSYTVRAGHIYYVATNGSDSQAGSQSAPWATIPHAFNTAACGDVIYAMNGVTQTGLDNYDASLAVERICSESAPLALVGYPGATVTIGSTSGQEYGIRNPDINGDGFNGIVFANLVVRGNNTAVKDVSNLYWRIVGSDFSCPNGSGEAACVQLESASNMQFLGNAIHDTGAGGTKYYHSFYGTTNSNHVEVGWNHIYNNQSCRGVQFYSTGGSPQYDLIVHDNIITGQLCDGINFSTIDATKGPIEAYNNLVYHVGLGGANLGLPNEACFASLGYGAPGGQAMVYGNTFVDCGSAGGSTAGAITVLSGSPTVVTSSNLIVQNPGEPVYSTNTDASLVAPTDDVMLTNGTAGVVNAQYQPVAGSPAIGKGTGLSGMLYDLAGNPRPQSGSIDAGAYLSSSEPTAPAAPTASLSATSMAFGNDAVATTTGAKVVTLSNSSSTALAINSISLGGANASSFITSNNCGTSLAAGQSCSIQAQFNPATAGSFSAAITISDNATNPSQTVTLTGTGTSSTTSPAVTLSATALSFGSQALDTTSATQTVTISNTGVSTLAFAGIARAGTDFSSFALTHNCGATLAAGKSCSIVVQFDPVKPGSLSAAINVTDNAKNSLQTITLTGTGVQTTTALTLKLSSTSLTFASQKVNTDSAVKLVQLTNAGKTAFTISSISMTGPNPLSFNETNNCASVVTAGAACYISARFNPRYSRPRHAAITIAENATGSPQSIELSGTGTN